MLRPCGLNFPGFPPDFDSPCEDSLDTRFALGFSFFPVPRPKGHFKVVLRAGPFYYMPTVVLDLPADPLDRCHLLRAFPPIAQGCPRDGHFRPSGVFLPHPQSSFFLNILRTVPSFWHSPIRFKVSMYGVHLLHYSPPMVILLTVFPHWPLLKP